ncbi:MAG: STAS domain-containing protein [Pseudonocardiaceae bacterium]|nr:MAG: STAS domain-containing protein [Pseudonocardiaceae bacterium]
MPDELSRRSGDPAFVQQLFEHAPRMLVGLTGPDLTIAAANAAARAFIAREHVVGTALLDSAPEVTGQRLAELYTEALATGLPQALHEWRVQFDLPDTGGQLDVVVDFTVTPMRAPDGSVSGLIVDVTDVTDTVRERQAARDRQADAERRFAQARDVIDALQRELLPAALPVLPRVQIAAAYLLADADTAAGGDWFDALPLPDGRVALVVGDVVGHGVAASATMGQLRVLLHEQLATSGDVAAALTALDAAADRIRGARAATVCVVVLDPRTGELTYCTAGHPAPLLLDAAGDARYLTPTGAGPVGVGGDFASDVVGKDLLGDDELVLLYTDGILERPGRELSASTVELSQVAADAAAGRVFFRDGGAPAERACTETLELLVRATGHNDDITLLAAQRVAAVPPLALQVPAVVRSLRGVREDLRRWLIEAHVGEGDAAAVSHALLELVTNVVEHTFVNSPGTRTCDVTVELTDDGRLHARVADAGRWREPVPTPDRGLGLHISQGLVDDLRVEHDDTGTTAVINHRAGTPARLLTTADLTSRRRTEGDPIPTPLLVTEQPWAPGPRVRVDGPVDATTVDEFERSIRAADVAGTRSLTVDLTGVSHLASAGVAALHRIRDAHRGNDTELRLLAPPGTPADMVLSLVTMHHLTRDPDTP